MHIERVYYQRNFQIGQFMFETVGIGISLDDGEDAEQALNEAKRLANEYHENNNPHIQSAPQQEPEVLPVQQVEHWEYSAHSVFENIQSCENWDDLKSFELLVKNNNEWKQAFEKRKKELNIIG